MSDGLFDSEKIVVVSGLPRSGTSLMMKMLEAGGLPPLTDRVRQADDDNPKGYYEIERVKKLAEGDTEWLSAAVGKSVKVITALLEYLPDDYHYSILMMRRNMDEILASQRQMLIRRGEDPNAMDDAVMAGLFEKLIRQSETWMSTQSNIRWLDVSYNQLLEDPGPISLKINDFLGGKLEAGKMTQVVDPALYRQRTK